MGNNRFRSGHANLCKYSETTLYFDQWESTEWRGRRIQRDSKISEPRGCWYQQNEGEIFCMIGLRSWRCCQIFDDRNAKMVGVAGVVWLAELAVPPFESHGAPRGRTDPQFAFGGLASYVFSRKKRKSGREFSSFPLHGSRDKDSSIRKSAKFLSQYSISIINIPYHASFQVRTFTHTHTNTPYTRTKLDTYTYTYTYIHTYICIYTSSFVFTVISTRDTSWASKRLQGKREACCLFDARGNIRRSFGFVHFRLY